MPDIEFWDSKREQVLASVPIGNGPVPAVGDCAEVPAEANDGTVVFVTVTGRHFYYHHHDGSLARVRLYCDFSPS